jgi:hypothetical protein
VASIVKLAEKELTDWRGHNEGDSFGRARVTSYWRAIGQAPQDPVNVPWSAAFVAAMAKAAEPGCLAESGAHIYYAQDALKRRQGNRPGYWAFEPGTVVVSPGDIVVRARGGSNARWPAVLNAGTFTETHGDIVARASRSEMKMIGGNVRDTVSLTTEPLVNGKLTGSGWVAHLVKREEPQFSVFAAGALALLPGLGVLWLGKKLTADVKFSTDSLSQLSDRQGWV